MLTVNDEITIAIREISFQFSRSPGPGGQNVNKVNTKVTLRWNVANSKSIGADIKDRLHQLQKKKINKEGELLLSSHRYRDQGRNVADCLAKLKDIVLRAAEIPKVRKKTKPSKRSNLRRLENKRKQSEKKRTRRQLD